MIKFLLKIKLLRKCRAFPTSNGMSYVELIVVLAIFAVSVQDANAKEIRRI